MKKEILKTLAATLFVSLMLTSCLGDGNSTKIEQNNALAYIKQSNSITKVAVTNSVAFTNDYLSTLESGNFYFLDFAVNTKDGQNSDGSYVAKNVSLVGDGYPIVKGNDYFNSPRPQTKVDIYPSQMNVAMFSSFKSALDDNWVFTYECRVYTEDKELDHSSKKDNIRLVATLLPEDQFTGSGETQKPLDPAKEVIVRLYLERYDESRVIDKTKDKVAHRGVASINLSSLRSHFRSQLPSLGEGGTTGVIQFKYITNTAKDNEEPKTEAKYLGSLSQERPDFYMTLQE